jgi:hypothetical protein
MTTLVNALEQRAPTATTPPNAQLRDRYRVTARSLDFEGHIEWAEAMP